MDCLNEKPEAAGGWICDPVIVYFKRNENQNRLISVPLFKKT